MAAKKREMLMCRWGRLARANPTLFTFCGLAVATLLHAALTPLWGAGYTFITYYPVITLATVVGGWKHGLFATTVSTLLSFVFFGSLWLPLDHAAALVTFLAVNFVVIFLAEMVTGDRRLAVSEVEHPRLFTGILRDITLRKELEREVVEVASLEQWRIGQDLHDSAGQELTALNILASDLAETLRTDPSNGSKLVEQMAQGLKRTQKDLRAVMRGLLPVAVDTEGLMAALSDLADRTQQEGRVSCKFDCPESVAVADNLTPTHVYLIAQEAVHNAVKHARPKNIRISLESNDLLSLNVQDDGIGMSAQPAENHCGLGLRIMRNRAVIIGATLSIQPAEPTGTLVTCALVRNKP